MKRPVKRILARFGVRVARTPPHRFDAMADCLEGLAARGFRPALVLDGGAHRGEWASLALPLFPGARFVLVEPQESCAADLARLAASRPGIAVVRRALTRPGVRTVSMDGRAWRAGSTGARVLDPAESGPGDVAVEAATVDEVAGAEGAGLAPVLLKLDLEGHEEAALEGAGETLARAGAVLVEVQAFAGGGPGAPALRRVTEALWARGFLLYDVASLAGRPRDGRLRAADLLFVPAAGPLAADGRWE